MVLLKILGAIDLAAALAFLMLIFGIDVFTPYLLFTSFLLLIKGLFILSGDVLSIIDLFSSIILILAIFINPISFFLWIPAFLLIGKGFISFV